jgi:hypothetical protein
MENKMDVNQSESVTPTDVSGASTETTTQTLSSADLDYKRDMLKYKDELSLAQSKLKEIELEKQQKKGNYEGVINSLKEEIKSLKAENTKSKYSFAETQLNSAIKTEALSRGVNGKKLDAFLKLIDDNDKGVVELDDSFNVNGDDVKTLVDKNMERYSELFTKKVNIVDGTPNSKPINQPVKTKSVSDMTWEEAVAYAKTLKD